MTEKKKSVGAIFLLLCLIFFFHDIFFSGKSFLLRDLFCDFFRWRLYAKEALLSLNFPLWNHYSNMGQPFMANPQSAVFYPFHAIFLIMDPVWAMKLSIVFHIFISGLLMFQLARHLLSFTPAIFVALTWMFNTHMIVQLEFHSVLTCITWMPLAVLQAIQITEIVTFHLKHPVFQILKSIFKPLAIIVLTLVIQFFAGNPQPLIFTLLIVCSYMIFIPIAHQNIRFFGIQILIISIVGIFALGLVMPQLILTWELIPFSIRGHDIDPGLTSGSVHPFHLITILLPYFWGVPGYFSQWLGKDWSLIEYWLGACYIGIPPLIMITLSLATPFLKSFDNNQRQFLPLLFFWIMGILGIVVSMGHYTPFYMFFYHVIPLFDRLRWPGNALCIPVFCFSVIAGYGFQWILYTYKHSESSHRTWANCILRLWFIIVLIAFILYLNINDSCVLSFWKKYCDVQHILEHQRIGDMESFIVYLSFGLIFLYLIRIVKTKYIPAYLFIGLLFINLYQVTDSLITYTDDQTFRYAPQKTIKQLTTTDKNLRIHSTYGPVQQWLYGIDEPEKFEWAMNASVGDTWLPYHIRKTWGGGSLRLASVTQFYALLEKVPPDVLNRLADILNIGYVIHGAPLAEVLTSQTLKKVNLTKRTTALPRAFFVSNWQLTEYREKALPIMISKKFNPRQQAVIVSRLNDDIPNPQQKQSLNSVLEIADNWNRTDIKVDTLDSSLLVLNDTWYPGWHAWVDGTEKPIYCVNAIFRGIFVEKGAHNICFVYKPDGLNEAFFVAIISIILFLFIKVDFRKRVSQNTP